MKMVGIKIICIDDYTWNSGSTYGKKYPLTIGKIYEITGVINEYFYSIVNDDGSDKNYPVDNFITLAEYRDKQIEEILNG